jgi:hypothetical protein
MKKSLSIFFNATPVRAVSLALLLAAVICIQVGYDATKTSLPAGEESGLSPELVRLADMGFHSTVGSFLWANTMPEILDIFYNGRTEYLADLDYLNKVDPKLSYPYAFSVLTLPAINTLPNRDAIAIAIGKRGIENADPDWRIPYYVATDYYLDLKDEKDALYYFDIAGRTPGIPDFAARFALNFGAIPNVRDKAIGIWTTIRDTTSDEATKERAQAYIDRLLMFNYLEAAAKQYKTKYGVFPKTLDDLVSKSIIPQIPLDPFGYTFSILSDGTVGIDQTKQPVINGR